MKTYTKKMGDKLNALLEKTYDAEKGYKKAAENVSNSGLKLYFKQKSEERSNFGRELKSELIAFGQEIDRGGSLKGDTHRAWMDIKSLFSSNDEEAMLKEAIRGEKAAIAEYNDVISDEMPLSTKNILESQRNTIESGLSTISGLKDLA